MRSAIFLLLTILTAVSCKYLDFRSKDEVVAEVNGKRLYVSEVSSLVPAGTPATDSIEMLKQYVNRWALKQLLLKKAEDELSKEERDIEQEMEDYRSSLLMYRYEKNYIDQRLDTAISQNECREYYDKNAPHFVLSSPVVKARFAKVSNSSPNLESLRRGYKAQSIEEIEDFERLCYSSAEKYGNFNNQWTDLSLVAREVPYDTQALEKNLVSSNSLEIKDSLYTYLIYYNDKFPSGTLAPFEYYINEIREIILSKRKQQLLVDLEKNLIRDAVERNHLKTNINKEQK
ncbi:MAG: hypothetical protein BGO30_00315 [Bacteroidetes bacterium 41-46]|nr:MAG: hypothetical protein BGO30_00315 [Bacteroidetes bacterium 41-46]